MDLTVAYIAEGKLYVRESDGAVRAVESKFVRDMLDRDERQRARDGWKQNAPGWQATSQDIFLAAQMGLNHGSGRHIAFTSVAADIKPGQCLFAINTDTVGGLFEFELPELERRLVHQPNLHLLDLARHPLPNGQGVIACAVQSATGTSNLAITNSDGSRLREITEGDSLDQCPAWVPIPGQVMVYQSAGLARDLNGAVRGISPYRIERLDLDRGELDTLREEEGFDLLMPRCDERQTLYCIRRPYRELGYADVPILTRIKYAVLWPFGVLAAFGAFLNVFSAMFRGKPLTPAGGPNTRKGPDAKQMFLWGRRVAADNIINDTSSRELVVVPRDWELVRIDATGNATVLARGVAAYDLLDDGSVVYTDGSKIHHRSKSGQLTELARHELIERLAVLPAASRDD